MMVKVLKKDNKKELTQLCKSIAKQKYHLTEKDINTLDYEERRNPYGKHKPPMKLYDISDLEELFCEKHDIEEDKIEETIKNIELDKQAKKDCKKEEKKEIIKKELIKNDMDDYLDNQYVKQYVDTGKNVKKILGKIKRCKELTDKLKLKGLNIRNDSALCSNYIDGDDEYTVDEIVEIMEEMTWLFKNTDYKNINKKIINEMIQECRDLRERYDMEFIKHEASAIAKYKAIEAWLPKNEAYLEYYDLYPSRVRNTIDEIIKKKEEYKIKYNNPKKYKKKYNAISVKIFLKNIIAEQKNINFNDFVKIFELTLKYQKNNKKKSAFYYYNKITEFINYCIIKKQCRSTCKNAKAKTCVNKMCGSCCIDLKCKKHNK